MVAEGVVLRRIEDLEHRARRVAAEVRAHLVDLVDHEHRVARARVAERADDRPRHRADVGAAVTADLGLVADPADRDPLEAAPERPGDRAPEARLADAGRPDEAEDRPVRLGIERADGEVLEDPVLDLLEVVVVLVEHLPRVSDVEVVGGLLRPGQLNQPLEVAADDAVLRRGGRQPFEPRELAVGGLARFLGQPGGVEPLAQLVDLRLGLVLLAELALDRLQLLAQVVLALALVHLRLDLGLDLRAELDHLELAREQLREPPQPAGDVDLLEQLLLLRGRDPQRPGDQVCERRGIVDVGDRELQLLREIRDLLDDLGEGALDVAGQGLELGGGLDPVGERLDPRDQVGIVLDVLGDLDPLGRLNQHPDRAVGNLEHAGDHPDHANVVELVRGRVIGLGVAGGDQDQGAAGAEHLVDQPDRAVADDPQRGQRVGIGDRILERQHRERRRQRLKGALADRRLDVVRLDDLDSVAVCLHGYPASEPRGSIGTRRVTFPASGSSTLRTPSS